MVHDRGKQLHKKIYNSKLGHKNYFMLVAPDFCNPTLQQWTIDHISDIERTLKSLELFVDGDASHISSKISSIQISGKLL